MKLSDRRLTVAVILSAAKDLLLRRKADSSGCALGTTMLAAPLALLAACSVGPDYVRPEVESPAAFKEMQGWKQAEPKDHEIRGKWWEIFGDPLLDALQEQV